MAHEDKIFLMWKSQKEVRRSMPLFVKLVYLYPTKYFIKVDLRVIHMVVFAMNIYFLLLKTWSLDDAISAFWLA